MEKVKPYELVNWASRLDIPPGPRAVLKEIAGHANSLGSCWPSQRRLAERTGYALRTIKRHMKWLIEQGYLQTERRQQGYIRHSDIKMLRVPMDEIIKKRSRAEENASWKEEKKSARQVSQCHQEKCQSDTREGANLAPASTEPSLEPSYKPSSEQRKEEFVFIGKNRIAIRDEGSKENPWWIEAGPIKLSWRVYQVIDRAFKVDGNDLEGITINYGEWLDKQDNPGLRANWRGALIKRIENIMGRSPIQIDAEWETMTLQMMYQKEQEQRAVLGRTPDEWPQAGGGVFFAD